MSVQIPQHTAPEKPFETVWIEQQKLEWKSASRKKSTYVSTNIRTPTKIHVFTTYQTMKTTKKFQNNYNLKLTRTEHPYIPLRVASYTLSRRCKDFFCVGQIYSQRRQHSWSGTFFPWCFHHYKVFLLSKRNMVKKFSYLNRKTLNWISHNQWQGYIFYQKKKDDYIESVRGWKQADD